MKDLIICTSFFRQITQCLFLLIHLFTLENVWNDCEQAAVKYGRVSLGCCHVSAADCDRQTDWLSADCRLWTLSSCLGSSSRTADGGHSGASASCPAEALIIEKCQTQQNLEITLGAGAFQLCFEDNQRWGLSLICSLIHCLNARYKLHFFFKSKNSSYNLVHCTVGDQTWHCYWYL